MQTGGRRLCPVADSPEACGRLTAPTREKSREASLPPKARQATGAHRLARLIAALQEREHPFTASRIGGVSYWERIAGRAFGAVRAFGTGGKRASGGIEGECAASGRCGAAENEPEMARLTSTMRASAACDDQVGGKGTEPPCNLPLGGYGGLHRWYRQK